MSWKGFKKAIARLPTQVTRGTETEDLDPDTLGLIREFEQLEALVTRLRDDVLFAKKSINGHLASQESFLSEFINLRGSDSASTEQPSQRQGDYNDQLQKNLENLKLSFDSTLPGIREALNTLDTGVLDPCNELIGMFKNVHKYITKREHKQIDYERHKSASDKLRASEKRDEAKMLAAESGLATAQQEHALVNAMLREQLPELLGVRVAFVRPCFATFVYAVSQVASRLSSCYRPVATSLAPGLKPNDIVAKYEAQRLACEALMADLSMLQAGASSSSLSASSSSSISSNAPAGAPAAPVQMPTPLHLPPPPHQPQSQPPPPPAAAAVSSSSSSSSFSDKTAQAQPSQQYVPTYTPAAAPIFVQQPYAMPHVNPTSTTTTTTTKMQQRRIVATYDFDAVESTDLGFRRGDIITVLESNNDRNSWWRGSCNGREGSFPANYTQDM